MWKFLNNRLLKSNQQKFWSVICKLTGHEDLL